MSFPVCLFITVQGSDRDLVFLGDLFAELIYTLAEKLAPCITVHGVLVDVYGEKAGSILGKRSEGKIVDRNRIAAELIREFYALAPEKTLAQDVV